MEQGRIFIDTNVFVYAHLKNPETDEKRNIIIQFLKNVDRPIVVSTQVINEFISVLLKYKINKYAIRRASVEIAKECMVAPVTLKTTDNAWALFDKYHFSYWDSLIVASAMECRCSVLFTEDLQHDQVIDERLHIINPLLL